MSPFELERRTFHEVIGLYSRVRDMQIRMEKQTQKQIRNTGRDGGIIRRPAGDNWF
jgi:hypothetical protein